MENGYYWMHLGALAGIGPLIWLWGREMLSCYFPFLLSARYCSIVKNRVLRKILISKQLNRSQSTRTRLEDRDKLPVIGAVYYGVGAVLLAAFYVSEVCAILEGVTTAAPPAVRSLARLSPWLILCMLLLGAVTFLLYRLDYGLGKHFNAAKGESG